MGVFLNKYYIYIYIYIFKIYRKTKKIYKIFRFLKGVGRERGSFFILFRYFK